MHQESVNQGASPSHLARQAERLERAAAFVSRPDCRTHILEKAAEFRAQAVLLQIAQRYAGDRLHSAEAAGWISAGMKERRQWT